jgi:RNA polymerase sigma-70 factor (ECF subfamily)
VLISGKATSTGAYAKQRKLFASGCDSSRADLVAVLQAVGTGNEAALAILYERTSAKLYGICLRVLGLEADAQEVLQDVYLAVWQRAATYDASRASPITWLAVMARNRAIDRLRKRQLLTVDIDEARDVRDCSPAAPDVLEAKQQHERVAECLQHLEARQQAMIRAAFLDGATYSVLAEREGVPIGTMNSLIRRGLLRMRTRLMDEQCPGSQLKTETVLSA